MVGYCHTAVKSSILLGPPTCADHQPAARPACMHFQSQRLSVVASQQSSTSVHNHTRTHNSHAKPSVKPHLQNALPTHVLVCAQVCVHTCAQVHRAQGCHETTVTSNPSSNHQATRTQDHQATTTHHESMTTHASTPSSSASVWLQCQQRRHAWAAGPASSIESMNSRPPPAHQSCCCCGQSADAQSTHPL